MTPIAEIDVADAHSLQHLGMLLVDVREPGEWALGSPAGARRIRLAEVAALLARELDRTTPVMTICGSGKRSLAAAEALQRAGFVDVRSVAGGFTRWLEAGLPSEVVSALGADERERYARHLLLPEIGEAGQLRLAHSRIALVGAGGLGSPAAYYLAAAGVGALRIVDHDVVDRSNLQRQILHTDVRVGEPKVESARATLEALNPRVAIDAVREKVTGANVEGVIGDADVVIDGSDNFPARYLLNDACVRLGKPLVYGAVHRFEGQASVFWPASPSGDAPCYRCLFAEPPPPEAAPNCAEAGVLGVVPGIIGLLQANEALKLLLGLDGVLLGRLLMFDALAARFREVRLRRDPQCPGCGPDAPREGAYRDYVAFCAGGIRG